MNLSSPACRPTAPYRRATAALAAALLASLLAGCSGKTEVIKVPVPPHPAISSTDLSYGGASANPGWAGYPVTLRFVGAHLQDPANPTAPQLLVATRLKDLSGAATSGPEVSAQVTLVGPPEAQVATLDLGAAQALPGEWRVTLSDARGLVVERTSAFVLVPAPTLDRVDRVRLCQGGSARKLKLTGTGLPYWKMDVSFVEGSRETLLPVGQGEGCSGVGNGAWGCGSVVVYLPDAPVSATGRLVVRVPGLGTVLPEASLSVAASWEAPGTAGPGPSGPRLAVFDAPGEVVAWQGSPALVRTGSPPLARLDGVSLALRPEGCEPTADQEVQRCTLLHATVPQGTSPGNHSLELTTEAGCTTTTSLILVDRPVLTALVPPFVCRWASEASFAREGSGLSGTGTYLSDGGTGPWTGIDPRNAWGLPAGTHLVRAGFPDSNPPAWSAALPLTVHPGPVVAWEYVSPQSVWSGARRRVQFWPDRFAGALTARLLPLPSGDPLPVEVVNDLEQWFFVFPATGVAGTYRLEIADQSPCAPGAAVYPFSALADVLVAAWDFEGATPVFFPGIDGASGPTGVEALAVEPGAGHPGAALVGRRTTDGADWYFAWFQDLGRADLGLLRFDLKASGTGAPSTSASLVISGRPSYSTLRWLRRSLPPPVPGSWTHYDVPLDDPAGWTATDNLGDRPATLLDLRQRTELIMVLGSWWSGPGEAALDNLALELAR